MINTPIFLKKLQSHKFFKKNIFSVAWLADAEAGSTDLRSISTFLLGNVEHEQFCTKNSNYFSKK